MSLGFSPWPVARPDTSKAAMYRREMERAKNPAPSQQQPSHGPEVLPILLAADHFQSPLMRQPSEITHMILQLLLQCDGPLRTRKRHTVEPYVKRDEESLAEYYPHLPEGRSEEVVDSYDLSTAILSTCQTLYEMGWPILYRTNTLGVQMMTPSESSISVYAAPEWVVRHSHDRPIFDLRGGQVERALLAKFQNIQIDVLSGREDEPVDALGELISSTAEIFRSKNLKINIFDGGPAGQPFEVYEYDQQLRFFTLLRCKKFEVLDFRGSESVLSLVTRTVQSDRPVLNLWKLKDKLCDWLHSLRAVCHHGSEVPPYCCCDYDAWDHLDEAALELDFERFFQLRAQGMKEFDEAYEKSKAKVFGEDLAIDESGLPVDPSGPDDEASPRVRSPS